MCESAPVIVGHIEVDENILFLVYNIINFRYIYKIKFVSVLFPKQLRHAWFALQIKLKQAWFYKGL